MPITSLTCTSRQARTHRLHWMQASRLTAIATWLRSGAGRARARAGGSIAISIRSAQFQNFEAGSCASRVAVGLIGDQQLEHHFARGLGAVGAALHLHAGRRRADAACGEHALALDLDHAGAAIAVRPVAGLGRVAQMRNVGALALGDLPDGLVLARMHFHAVEREGDGLAARARRPALCPPARCARRRPALDLGVAAGRAFARRGRSRRVLVVLVHGVTICPSASRGRRGNT